MQLEPSVQQFRWPSDVWSSSSRLSGWRVFRCREMLGSGGGEAADGAEAGEVGEAAGGGTGRASPRRASAEPRQVACTSAASGRWAELQGHVREPTGREEERALLLRQREIFESRNAVRQAEGWPVGEVDGLADAVQSLIRWEKKHDLQ